MSLFEKRWQNKTIMTPVIMSILLFAVSMGTFRAQQSGIKTILEKEVKRHPASKPRDIYKFLYQAAFGSAHAVNDTNAVRKWMEREISNLDYSIKDELIDTLSPNGRIVRVNLCPYLEKSYAPEKLLNAFIQTANKFNGSVHDFLEYWKAAEALAAEGKFNFTKAELNNYFTEQEKKDFPAVHHSDKYSKEYKPAYRVVDVQYLDILSTSF